MQIFNRKIAGYARKQKSMAYLKEQKKWIDNIP